MPLQLHISWHINGFTVHLNSIICNFFQLLYHKLTVLPLLCSNDPIRVHRYNTLSGRLAIKYED